MTYRHWKIAAGCLGAVVLLAAAWPAEAQVFVGARGMVMPIAPGGGVAGPAKNSKAGVHIPKGRSINFAYTMTDGAGFRWDIQYYGTIGQGTNYAYSGGLYLQVNGSSVHSNNQGWINKDGDEVELGPYARNNVRVYRRIKVYKDMGLARWLDIFENPTDQEVNLSIRVYSNTNWTIGQRTFSSGKGTFTDKDYAFITQTQGGNAPATMHYVCGERAKLRPTVNIQNNQIYVNYRVKIPPKGTSILCYFESQNNSVAELNKLMKSIKPYRLLRDLSPSVRKLLLNMPVAGGIGGVELTRNESSDTVITGHGDPIYGKIENESFDLSTLFGPMKLPAGQVVGMAAVPGEEGRFRVLLTGGQVIAGAMADSQKLKIAITTGGDLTVPFTDVQQASYQITEARPEDMPFKDPLMILRTGDRVAFDAGKLQLKLRTRQGTVDLRAGDLLAITMDNPGNGVHRVSFLNGSQLAGFLEPQTISLSLTLGPKLDIPRDLISNVQFAVDEKPDDSLDSVKLSNGDELFGKLMSRDIVIQTNYGPVTLQPENIKAITFSPTHLGRVAVQSWDGSTYRGQCGHDALTFQIVPGPKLDLYVGQCVEITRNVTVPPKDVLERVEKFIAKLGAESYKDRQAASESLFQEGKRILPLLQKHLDASDPEVRQRLRDVIERLGGKPQPPDDDDNDGPMIIG